MMEKGVGSYFYFFSKAMMIILFCRDTDEAALGLRSIISRLIGCTLPRSVKRREIDLL
ncbi:uncharacterized protein CIMG_07138 [Coccidioides immitis RS]|uniref:Uncharacterized protein n=3 Tax=Coccidioides immitis TaxID=5501 RepID=A0A0E1RX64_COCIM|nr:uncharacterized protein CIMG_07138 [Coccidioides immitis RS]EAS31659.2 hypothetical protein CIMG_07138 [Coccidioides immitis RS]KMP04320.1 hypothetical protein CIRG_04011 [Coccidioides immitis RMSCC 2394]KMU87137.1 hypothetical protein CIHG_05077 [Coccidioides immitis H538.4]